MMKRYYSFNDYMQQKYGEKVYKLALDAGLSCPNRDDEKAGGCIFCADGGSGHFAKKTLEEAKAFLRNQKDDEEPHAGELSNMQYYSDTRTADMQGNSPADEVSGEYYSEQEGDEAPASLPAESDESFEFYSSEASNEPMAKSSYGEGWERQSKNVGNKYVAYYQTYSNTNAPADELREIFSPALSDPEIVEVAIATRPDCINDDVIKLLVEMNSVKPVWVELGLQTKLDRTADYIKRGYHLDVFEDALKQLRGNNIDVVVHLIMGLPGEDFEDMLETVRYVNSLDIQGVKIHMLTVIKGTELGDRYEEAVSALPSGNGMMDFQTKITFADGTDYMFIPLEKYADLICATLGLLRPEIVIHRLTGDAPKDALLSPMWTADKKRVLNSIHKQLERRNITQGCLIKD